jgi:hypothetical protein
MKVELLSYKEAKKLGLLESRLISEGHGAFGEPDNYYGSCVIIGDQQIDVHENNFIIFQLVNDKPTKRSALQVVGGFSGISDLMWQLFNPEKLDQKRKDTNKKYIDLRNQVKKNADLWWKNKTDSEKDEIKKSYGIDTDSLTFYQLEERIISIYGNS